MSPIPRPPGTGFNNPLDNGDLAPGLPGQLRNQFFVDDAAREHMLVIDGGATQIAGADVNAQGDDPQYAMGGRFYDEVRVGLGQLRTDEAGRLMVFPPDGVSHSPSVPQSPVSPIMTAGTTTGATGRSGARVKLPDGRELEADHGWIACVGPNFAPEIPPITTLYDVIEDMNVRGGLEREAGAAAVVPQAHLPGIPPSRVDGMGQRGILPASGLARYRRLLRSRLYRPPGRSGAWCGGAAPGRLSRSSAIPMPMARMPSRISICGSR